MAGRKCLTATAILAGLAIAAAPALLARGAERKAPGVTRAPFGKTPEGQAVEAFTLTNRHGLEVRAITYGCIIVSLRVPDRQGRFDDVVLGHNELGPYLKNPPYLGAVIGRYGNRIAGARFTLEGKTYRLAANDGPNHIHGGRRGFDKVVWKAEPFERTDAAGVLFTHTSPDGDEGYPGTLEVRVTYTLNDSNELLFEYVAKTDAPTPVNLTQHSYFNLAGEGSGDVLGHELVIYAETYTPVGPGLIPTGETAPLAGTPLDFRERTRIGARIEAGHDQMRLGHGYDHNFVLAHESNGLSRAALVVEPRSGRRLELLTTEPGVQFYSGNFLDGTLVGKRGRKYERRSGFCLETQHFPNSPNQSNFPTTVLLPGQEYRTQTVLRFGIEK